MATTVSPPDTTPTDRRLRGMGTRIHLTVTGPTARAERWLDRAALVIDDLERRWSRFQIGSEISAVNRHGGDWVGVSPETIDLVDHAVLAHRLTGGRFDPTVDVEAIGYERSFDQLGDPVGGAAPDGAFRSTAESPFLLSDPSHRVSRCGDIEVDRDRRAVRLPAGITFDPGGIGKGLAADHVTWGLMEMGATGALVNIGGDLRARGIGPVDGHWLMSIHEPAWRTAPLATIALTDGAVATSTTRRRRWIGPLGVGRHHVIDSATGVSTTERPADVVVATAVAGAGWWAEASATASIGRRIDELPDVQMVTGTAAGAVHRTPGFERYER